MTWGNGRSPNPCEPPRRREESDRQPYRHRPFDLEEEIHNVLTGRYELDREAEALERELLEKLEGKR